MTIALIPARAGSKGIPNKNFRPLVGLSPVDRAIQVAGEVCDRIVLSTDAKVKGSAAEVLQRPAALSTDDAPMSAVIEHALQAVGGDAEDIWVLLQPTQPLRTADQLRAGLAALTGRATSVVSVVPLPAALHPDRLCEIWREELWPRGRVGSDALQRAVAWRLSARPRQATHTLYVRDGTFYIFPRRTVALFQDLYGPHCRPFPISPSESCPLDTPEDWAYAEFRLTEEDR